VALARNRPRRPASSAASNGSNNSTGVKKTPAPAKNERPSRLLGRTLVKHRAGATRLPSGVPFPGCAPPRPWRRAAVWMPTTEPCGRPSDCRSCAGRASFQAHG
jgi:hypothetical protein